MSHKSQGIVEENVPAFRLLSQAPESSEQFAWLSRSHREMETQLAHSGTAPSIPADLSQNEAI